MRYTIRMTREHVLMVLGALVLLSPWSGIPMEFLEWALLLIGLAIIGIAFTMRKRADDDRALPSAPAAAFPSAQEPQSRSSHIAFS